MLYLTPIIKISIPPQNDNVGFTNIKVSIALENTITAESIDSIREKILAKIKNAIDIDKLICDWFLFESQPLILSLLVCF